MPKRLDVPLVAVERLVGRAGGTGVPPPSVLLLAEKEVEEVEDE